MKWRFRVITVAILAVAAWMGYELARTAAPQDAAREARAAAATTARRVPADSAIHDSRSHERKPVFRSDRDALEAGALPGQRSISFANRAAMDRFLAAAGSSIQVMDRIDALNTLRIGFLNQDDLDALLDGSEETGMIFPVTIPEDSEGKIQQGAAGLGSRLLAWLGVTDSNQAWGTGVRIAVLDTGIAPHSSLSGKISSFNLVELGANARDWNGHGTAVASLIAGSDRLTPGVAPAADLISIRIADDNGRSDSFMLAKGILAAVDSGAQLINISMGSYGDSVLVQNALKVAQDSGAAVIASAGNDGTRRISYPAAYPGVISVGAVDANGSHMSFSNSGQNLSVAAPGYEVNAAWTGDKAIGFTGTSASAPIVTGVIAAVMSNSGSRSLSASQATKIVLENLNDGGAPGFDEALGGGTVDLGRSLIAGTRGIYDAAVASNWIHQPNDDMPYPQLEVTVQNRGTETLYNTALDVRIGGSTTPFNITSLAPGAIRTYSVPLPSNAMSPGGSFSVDSRVTLGAGEIDGNASNDQRTSTFGAATAP